MNELQRSENVAAAMALVAAMAAMSGCGCCNECSRVYFLGEPSGRREVQILNRGRGETGNECEIDSVPKSMEEREHVVIGVVRIEGGRVAIEVESALPVSDPRARCPRSLRRFTTAKALRSDEDLVDGERVCARDEVVIWTLCTGAWCGW